MNDISTKEKPQWCPGCGNYGILTAVKNAITELALEAEEVVLVSGIGCGSKLPHYVNTYGFESLHGRSLPVASGIKLANHKLTVIAISGDGDGYGIGVQHFVHIARRNYDITYIVQNNGVYGLTTGQISPTGHKGMKTKSTPHGAIEIPFNPIAAAIANGATYVARGFAGDLKHLTELIKGGIKHRGFAFIDVFQPCVTFNTLNTYQWFQQRIYKLDENGWKTNDKIKALEKAFEDSLTNYQKVPIGLFYKEERPTYEDELPQLKEKPLAHQDISNVDISKSLDELA
jgi:2-oxoglutarate ferredoxin oxidoreductase subunit beta